MFNHCVTSFFSVVRQPERAFLRLLRRSFLASSSSKTNEIVVYLHGEVFSLLCFGGDYEVSFIYARDFVDSSAISMAFGDED